MPLAKLSLPDPLANTTSILNNGLLAKPDGDGNSGTSDLLLGSLFSSNSSINANSNNSRNSAIEVAPIDLNKIVTGGISGIANAVGITKIGGELVDKLFPSAAEVTGDTLLQIPGTITVPPINDIGNLATGGFINSSSLAAANAPTSIFTKAKIFAGTPLGTGTLAAIPSLLKGDIKGGIGSGLGAYAALSAFPGAPIIAPIVGAILGKKVLKGVTKKLGIGGGTSVGPNSGGSGLVGEDGQLKLGDVGADNGGTTGFVTSFLNSVATKVNQTLNESGDRLELPVNSRPLYVEVIKNKVNIYDAPGSFRTFEPNQVDQAFNYAVSMTLKGKDAATTDSPNRPNRARNNEASSQITSELDRRLIALLGS